MERTRFPSTIEIPEVRTKDLFINGYIVTLIRRDDPLKPIPSYRGMKGWALQEMYKMKRTIYPIQYKRTL